MPKLESVSVKSTVTTNCGLPDSIASNYRGTIDGMVRRGVKEANIQLLIARREYLGKLPRNQFADGWNADDRLCGAWLSRHKALCNLEEITRQEISSRASTIGSSHGPGAERKFLTYTRKFFDFCLGLGIAQSNPAYGIKPTTMLKEVDRWKDVEIKKALAAATPPIRRGIILCLYTGQRIGDVLEMKWRDIERGAINVTQQKTGHKLLVPIHPELFKELAPGGRGHLVASNDLGDGWRVNSFRQRFVKEMKTAGLGHLKLHGLRKTFASKLAEGGATTKQIMAIGGWKKSTMVDLYARQAEQEILAREAIRKFK